MPRLKLSLPTAFHFSCQLPIRITDINYGGHVGNDKILTLLHEARVQYLNYFGYSELNFAGASLIMADVSIEFKSEVFYGDVMTASLIAGDFQKVSFDIYYQLEKQKEGKKIVVASAKTGMVCFDYHQRKIAPVPSEAIEKLSR